MATYLGKGKLNFIEELADTVYINVDETGVFYYEAPFGLSITDLSDFDKVYNVFVVDEDEGFDLVEDHGEIVYDSNSEDAHYLLSKNFFRFISEEQHPFEVEDVYNGCMTNNNKVKDDELIFAKVKEGAVIPSKRDEDGAYDLYACFEEDYIVIQPHETKLIPTGIATAFTSKWVAIIKERGSNGSKGIAQRCGVIDSGFRGEWWVPLTNTTNDTVVISKLPKEELPLMLRNGIVYPYTKGIGQIIMVEVPKLKTKEISYEDLLKIESERGTGCLGSSGK